MIVSLYHFSNHADDPRLWDSQHQRYTMMYFVCDDDCLLHYHDYDDDLDETDYYDDYYDDDHDEYGSDDSLNVPAEVERALRELETITDEQREAAEVLHTDWPYFDSSEFHLMTHI